jgi:hypothetical protein
LANIPGLNHIYTIMVKCVTESSYMHCLRIMGKSKLYVLFLPACTYVQRGSKFCFVVLVLVLVLGDTLIKLQWQDTKLQWQDTKLQWQDTKMQWQDT